MVKKNLNERHEQSRAGRKQCPAKKNHCGVRPRTIRDRQYQPTTSRMAVPHRRLNVEALVDVNVETELVRLFRNAHPSCIKGDLSTITLALIANKGQSLSPNALLDVPDRYYMTDSFVDSLCYKLFGLHCNTCV